MSIRIRALDADRAGEVMTVQRAAYLVEARRYGAWDLPPLVETLAQVRDHISSGQPALGAFDGHRLVGSVRGNVDGDRMEVARLFVAPDQQGRGIGRKLLDAAAGAAPSGVDVLWLFTGARSEENIRLYESAGFVKISERVDGLGITLVTLERKVI
ncbi:GNAT family N-acetyltransferase [Lentzea sp. NPDC042327]|uniref:GNAT family N-acetyltransferase n=1 Tax=Lentzea sp. NPDC042327 TaxID=3154801 RepID=UPI0033F7C8F2